MNTINNMQLNLHAVRDIELGASEINVTRGGHVYSTRRVAIHTTEGEVLQLLLFGDAGGVALIEHHATDNAGAGA